MKYPILIVALLAGTAAFAQPPADTAAPPEAAPAAAPAEAPAPDPVPAEQSVAPGNDNPATDATGTPAASDPAQVPAGFNQAPGTPGIADATQRPTPQPASETYPRCSRSVTDNCVQAEARGRRRR